MGQEWTIVNIDKKEQIYSEYPDTKSGRRLVSTLREVKWPSFRELLENHRIHYRKKGVSRSLGNLEIPEELIYMIFSHIDHAQTAVTLGTTNTRLMIIGEKRIKQLMGDPNWTGDRLVFLGDSLEHPDGLDLGNDYEAFLQSDAEYKFPGDWARDFPDPARDLWRTRQAECINSSVDRLTYYLEWERGPEFWFALGLSRPVPVFLGNPEVIWNLTKRVYFRYDAIPELPPCNFSDFDDASTMGTILLLQICWSDSGNRRLPRPSGSHCRGKWAGDRFQLTDKDVLETRKKEGGCDWKDVSEEVIGLFMRVYDLEYC